MKTKWQEEGRELIPGEHLQLELHWQVCFC